MKTPDQRPEAQPWHPADSAKKPGRNAPLGTHSLTGGGAGVGMPATPDDAEGPGDDVRDERARGDAGDLLKEPRAGAADLLGRKG